MDLDQSLIGREFVHFKGGHYCLVGYAKDSETLEDMDFIISTLPTKSVYCSTIAAGDLMLYGSNCVVLFYGSAGGYSYTRIGKLESTEGLAAALGTGAAKVTFAKAEVKANIEMKDGKPVVSAETNMPSTTSFTVLGATDLANPEWTEVVETESSDYRFFKVATK